MRGTHAADQGSQGGTGPAIAGAPPAPPSPPALPSIPDGGGRVIVNHMPNGSTAVTFTSLPPAVMLLAQRAEETAFGLMGLLAAIIILGPFARMWARRLERTHELKATSPNTLGLQQQLEQLQQSMDAMSVEMERVGEAQRFQSKLLVKKEPG